MHDPGLRARLHAAAVEGRAALATLADLLTRTERELLAERRQLADAERRGQLADGIGDGETARVAREYVARHGERVAVLERKLDAQHAEIALLTRDVDDVVRRLKLGGVETDAPPPSAADREAEAEARLAELKRRMGR